MLFYVTGLALPFTALQPTGRRKLNKSITTRYRTSLAVYGIATSIPIRLLSK